MNLLPDPEMQRDLQNAVARLPRTADGIAAELAERGIKAKRFCSTGCALAVHFQQETGAERVSVLFGVNVWDGDRRAAAELPPAATDFLRAFDRGDYPGLVEQDEHALTEATA